MGLALRWEGKPLWGAVEKAVADLVQNQDLFKDEYREYIVGYICKIIDRRKRTVIAQLGSMHYERTPRFRRLKLRMALGCAADSGWLTSASSEIACSIKGNVKENTSPLTGSGEQLLDFQPPTSMKDACF